MTETLTKKIKKAKGFTLIELIIVVAIIAILAALAIPKLMGTQENAKKKADIANGKMIHDTVAKLITEDSITLPSTLPTTVSIATGGATMQQTIWNELQTQPKATYGSHKGNNFSVTINADKSITVTVDSVNVYPNQGSDYQ